MSGAVGGNNIAFTTERTEITERTLGENTLRPFSVLSVPSVVKTDKPREATCLW
jgi:hypothetical protein